MRRITLLINAVLFLSALYSCAGEEGAPVADAVSDVALAPESGISFNFDWSSHSMAASPFPNNLHLGDDGRVQVDPLADTPWFAELAHKNILEMIDAHVAQRRGFGFASAVFFPVTEEIDLTSLEGRVTIITLDGPEAPREVGAQIFWNAHAGALGVFPSWGDYFMPDSTYAVLIEKGALSVDGALLDASSGFLSLTAKSAMEPAEQGEKWSRAREIYSPLRAYLDPLGDSAPDLLVGTVFKTEPTMDYLGTLISGLDTYALTPPTRAVRWDPEISTMEEADPTVGVEAIKAYFGEASGRFIHRPGRWSDSARENVVLMEEDDEAYGGGTLSHGIAEVHHGSILAPALNYAVGDKGLKNTGFSFDDDGLSWSLDAMIPFTLFLCEQHVESAANIPVAIFSHGGTSDRTDAIGYATLNCLEGVATIAPDMPFHAGRSSIVVDGSGTVLLPVGEDKFNAYTGLTDEEAGYVADHVGDNPGAVATAGNLFGIEYSNDPLVMEANLLMFSLDTYIFARYLLESDWSGIRTGLSFDSENIFHDSLSFGTTLTTALLAGTSVFKAAFNGVGAAYLYSANLTVAPSNGRLASSVVQPLLGLKSSPADLQAGAYTDPIVALIQWLSQRGDAVGYAPYVFRHREVAGQMDVLGVGNSWDETLSSWAQYSFNGAFGYGYFRAGEEWTLDPSIPDIPADLGEAMGDTPVSQNLKYGNESYTGGIFFHARSCHSLQVKPVCIRTYELQYPPIKNLDEKVVFDSPICAYQHQARHFLRTSMAGNPEIIAPDGDCQGLYGAAAP